MRYILLAYNTYIYVQSGPVPSRGIKETTHISSWHIIQVIQVIILITQDVDPDSLIERKPSIQSWIQSADMPQARPFTSTSGHDDDDHDDRDD